MKWSKVDQIIQSYKKRYPKRWAKFLVEMDKARDEADNGSSIKLCAKFPAYPDGRDISGEVIKIIPDFIINDYKWKRFKKLYPEFFR